MKPRTNGRSGTPGSKSFQREGTNWIVVAGGALLSTLSIRLGYKLKQALDAKPPKDTGNGNGESADRKKSRCCQLHSNGYCFTQEDDDCFNYVSGSQGIVEMKQQQPDCPLLTQPDTALPLVTVPAREFNKENGGVLWSSSPDRLDLPQKPFHHSNSSESPSVSESGSDIFSKREVIQKLRQQLKRRDDMVLEMQDRIVELQNALGSQMSHSTHLQSAVDAVNRDLIESQREIQRLRKVISDHCVGQNSPRAKIIPMWAPEVRNGHTNGFHEVESSLESSPEKGKDMEKIDMLRREVSELKEIIEGKEFLLHSYKEQKTELSLKVKELQERLDSQLPNIL